MFLLQSWVSNKLIEWYNCKIFMNTIRKCEKRQITVFQNTFLRTHSFWKHLETVSNVTRSNQKTILLKKLMSSCSFLEKELPLFLLNKKLNGLSKFFSSGIIARLTSWNELLSHLFLGFQEGIIFSMNGGWHV